MDRAFLFGAHVRGHQELGDRQAVSKGFVRHSFLAKRLHHVPVLADVPVLRFLVGHDRHHARLGVLLLDQVLARVARYFAAQEDLESRVERVDLHGVLGTQELHAEPKSGPDVAP